MYCILHLLLDCFDALCGLFAFGFGARVSFTKKGVLFLQIITCAFGCFFLGNIYNLCYFFCLNEYVGPYKNGFGIGSLGYIGGLVFLFSSYYGAMNRLGDDNGESMIKFRLIPSIPAFFNFAACVVVQLTYKFDIYFWICMTLLSAISYFAFKNIILPDVENGILASLRIYNLLIFLFCEVQILYNIFNVINKTASPIFQITADIITLIIVPMASRGVKKWYT